MPEVTDAERAVRASSAAVEAAVDAVGEVERGEILVIVTVNDQTDAAVALSDNPRPTPDDVLRLMQEHMMSALAAVTYRV